MGEHIKSINDWAQVRFIVDSLYFGNFTSDEIKQQFFEINEVGANDGRFKSEV